MQRCVYIAKEISRRDHNAHAVDRARKKTYMGISFLTDRREQRRDFRVNTLAKVIATCWRCLFILFARTHEDNRVEDLLNLNRYATV